MRAVMLSSWVMILSNLLSRSESRFCRWGGAGVVVLFRRVILIVGFRFDNCSRNALNLVSGLSALGSCGIYVFSKEIGLFLLND